MKKKIKILLADPRHSTVGAHSNYTPIGIAYIASYLKTKINNFKLDIILSTEPNEIFNLLKTFKPHVIGLSNYIWNSDLSYLICEEAKRINDNTLCVLGGPEFPAGTGARKIEDSINDQTYTKSYKYVLERPSMDYFAYSDGEVAFLELIKKFIECEFDINKIKINDLPVSGCASLSLDKKRMLVGNYIPRIGMEGSVKSHGRDIIPSPYLTGMLDKFLDGSFVPSFETARGCPFMCTFCDQGLDQSKITAFSTERLTEEMEYVAKKLDNVKGTKTIAIFDSNFGLFQKDVDLADHLLKIMEKYDWPKHIEAIAPKSNRENILKINDKLKNRVQIGLSMQSLNIQTLTDIKRRNWTTEQYIDFVKEIEKRGKTPTSEIIIPLPGETKETYYEGIKFLMDHNVQPGTYTLMMLCGAELGRDAAIKKYQMKSKYRILPKQFGEYNNKKCFEIEKICVETNTMSEKDYLDCRNYSFVVRLLSSQVFNPIYKMLTKLNISWYDFSIKVSKTITDDSFKGKLKDLFEDFCKESQNELFDSKDEVVRFYSDEKNYEKLRKGLIGENLLAKYSAKSLMVLDEIFNTIYDVLNLHFKNYVNQENNKIIKSSEKWIKNLYMINEILAEDKISNIEESINIDFDFPSWLSNSNDDFGNYYKKAVYKFENDNNKIVYMKGELKSIYNDYGNDKTRAFGRYLMQYVSRGMDVFERNYQKIS
jgi:radical SAM superfamily enzyme YgiQ (UPF0313 family)